MCQVIKAEDVHVEEKCKYEKWLKITFKIKKKGQGFLHGTEKHSGFARFF